MAEVTSQWQRNNRPLSSDNIMSSILTFTIPSTTNLKRKRGLCSSDEFPQECQAHLGRTPLQNAILNPQCTPEILKILMKGDPVACFTRDDNGLLPIDHLIMRVHADSPNAIKLLKTFIECQPAYSLTHKHHSSPLIRLLMISASKTKNEMSSYEENQASFFRILEVTKCLLDREPDLLYNCSSATGCSPLHLALRNYGNFLPLIQELCSRDDVSNRLMTLRNNFGDLPIHVASSMGVPTNTLSFILQKTNGHLLWSKNNFGYTPMDMEFMNYIEFGSNLADARSLYPLRPRGRTQDSYYQNLHEQNCNQLLGKQRDMKQLDRYNHAKEIFGVFLDRMFLIISSTFTTPLEQTLLHKTCRVCSYLPLSLLKIVVWLYHDDLLRPDAHGNLPLHIALGQQAFDVKEPSNDWKFFCLHLIDAAPEASKIVGYRSRLPLHVLLTNYSHPQNSVREIVVRLLQHFPESVGTRDAHSNLDPYMLAAKNMDLSYFLLSQCPSILVKRPAIPNS